MYEQVSAWWPRKTLLGAAGLTLLFWLLLVLEGRPTWCKYGLGLWSSAFNHCTSQNFIDPYSLSHFLHGVIFFWMLKPLAARFSLSTRFLIALAVEIGWELLENSPWVIERYRQNTASLDYAGDSILNSLGDLASAAVGFLVAAKFSWKAAIAMFAVCELSLLYLARDTLTFNVIMLIYPFEVIKEWQLGG